MSDQSNKPESPAAPAQGSVPEITEIKGVLGGFSPSAGWLSLSSGMDIASSR